MSILGYCFYKLQIFLMQVTMQLSADHIWSFKRDSLSDFSVILNNYVSLFLFIFLKKAQHTTEKK